KTGSGSASDFALFGCFLLALAGSVLVDRLLDRRAGAPDEIGAVTDRVIVAAAQEVAALLEVRVDEPGHQFVMPLRLLPIGPVLRQLAQDAEPARALHQPLDISDRIVGRANAGG